jgi:hypothetical protein
MVRGTQSIPLSHAETSDSDEVLDQGFLRDGAPQPLCPPSPAISGGEVGIGTKTDLLSKTTRGAFVCQGEGSDGKRRRCTAFAHDR